MRIVGRFVALMAVLVVSTSLGGRASAATPQCSDGVDNDGDGLIDFTGGSNGFTTVGPDPQCRSATWNSEASASDLGVGDGGVITEDGMIPPGETVHDGSNPFEPADASFGSSAGGPPPGVTPTTTPIHQGCDVGGDNAPVLPLLMVLAIGCGLALLSRRTRA